MDRTAVLDLSGALSRADGDQDLFLTLARLFLQESPKEAAAARAALGRQDRAGLAAAAHKLRGSVMEMRLAEVHAALRELIARGFPS